MTALPPESCDCCTGREAGLGPRLYNPPGQPAIAYRIGRHGSFRQSLLARMSAAEFPALRALRTREDDDFGVALCDATATMLEVLSFYQERIANEHYLRTATEAGSVCELARLIGYRPAPGVAANVELAFTLDEAPGAPELAALPVVLPVGTRAQSVPGPDETAQVFETVEAVEARPNWNAIPVWAHERQEVAAGATALTLAGTGTMLAPGDALLVVGPQREALPASNAWDLRMLCSVQVDPEANTTRVAWAGGLRALGPATPAADRPRVFALRQRAARFGHNAPDPNLFSANGTDLDRLAPHLTILFYVGPREWAGYDPPGSLLDLDAAYPRIAPGSWCALVDDAGRAMLCRVNAVADHSRADFGLSAKVTRITPDTAAEISLFGLRATLVLAQSEELALAPQPLTRPLYGTELALARVEPGLGAGRQLALAGKPARVEVVRGAPALTLLLADGSARMLVAGDSLQVAGTPEIVMPAGARAVVAPGALVARMADSVLAWRVRDRDGSEGSLEAPPAALVLAPALKSDKAVSETARAASVRHARERTVFTLGQALAIVFDRATTTVNGNVAGATAGESVGEILGNGDAARPDQRFTLKQAPLTFVAAASSDGRAATLEVRVNGLKWEELPGLYGAAPARRGYTLHLSEGGQADVVFGDGVEGARVPTGAANVRATYRKGTGAQGNVPAGRIKTLLTRPLGVNAVINPARGYGGQDPEPLREARRRASVTVLTLDRAVSVLDYADYARTFAGVAKAHAVLIRLGPARGIFLSVAGPNGEQPPAGGATMARLADSLRRHSDAQMGLAVRGYEPLGFRLRAAVRIAPDAPAPGVLAQVRALLLERFGFDAREFGQPVSQDEVLAAMHGAAGVTAVALAAFHLAGKPAAVERILWPRLPAASLTGAPRPAQLLMIDPAGIELGVMA